MRGEHTLGDGDTNIVTAAVPWAAHGISMAALLPPPAGEAARRSLLGAVAVTPNAALLVVTARIHLLCKEFVFLGQGGGAVGGRYG